MKKVYLIVFVLTLGLYVFSSALPLNKKFEEDSPKSEIDLSGEYILLDLEFSENGVEAEEAEKKALFYQYKDGKTLTIDKLQTTEIEKTEVTNTATFIVRGNELELHFFNQGKIYFNGQSAGSGNSYTIYEFQKTSNGFVIERETPAIKEKYVFSKK